LGRRESSKVRALPERGSEKDHDAKQKEGLGFSDPFFELIYRDAECAVRFPISRGYTRPSD